MALAFSFENIASVYDAQRAHPPEVAAQIGQTLVGLIGSCASLLELGVGTGRIALPTAQAGGLVAGLDISAEMLTLAAQRAKATEIELALICGDAQQLPFPDQSFEAVLAVHVLHLLPDWRSALSEIVRVLKPGGLFVQGSDWRDPDSCVGRLRTQLRLAAIEFMPGSRPPGAGAALAQALARSGGRMSDPFVAATWVNSVSPADVLAGMAARFDAETWVLSDTMLAAVMERVHAWAEATWSDLTEPEMVEHRFILNVTRIGTAEPELMHS